MELAIALTVTFIIYLGFIFLWRMSRYNKNLPLSSVDAVVIKKRIDEWKGGTNSPIIKEYYVEFDIQGEKIELKVLKRSDYERLETGSSGVLSYQINRLYKLFVRFDEHA
ncbi:DUF2500 domain-containing protein [Paenibacillus pasadenensis]|uniref:DUF2500 family protein n=1 Tax=Paenibacillus pasadenensis TaxID=217090 RepID=UPI00203B89C4|nr:DUF2500 family protein [Paenibacillus pasadenensis]MCM3750073.1 DUF2500 domain-containing protein [Paenibacillus pasadenensis]